MRECQSIELEPTQTDQRRFIMRSASSALALLLSLALITIASTIAAQGPPPPPTPLQPPPQPPGNPVTAAKANLGKTLFWDEQLSSHRIESCGTCHQGHAGGSDPRSILGSGRSL